MTDRLTDRIEALRRAELTEGCKKIDAALGKAVEEAFDSGYSADQVHRMLTGSLALTEQPALRSREG